MNNKMTEKISLEEILYYIMFSLLISLKGLGLDEASFLFRVGLVIALFVFGMKILIGKYSIKELLLIALGGVWGSFVFFNVGSLSILIYALIIFGMKNISVPKVMKVGAVVYSVCFFVTVTAALFFHRPGVQLVHEKLGLGPILRESLGYTHPNVLHVTYIVLMAFVLYGCKKENVFKTIAALMLGNIFVFIYSLSYTGLLISVAMIFIYLYFIYRKKISAIENDLIKCILPLCICVSTIVAYVVEGRIYEVLNKLLNNRVWAIKVFFDDYNLTALGEKILRSGFSLDNSYIYALAWYGMVFLVIIVIGYWLLIEKYLKEDKRRKLAIIIAFLFAGMTEQFLFNASIKNITFIFLGDIIFRSIQKENKELDLLSKYNRFWNISFNKLIIVWEKGKKINWKKILVSYLLVNVLALGVLLFIPTNRYERVYVNERMCDCNGEIVEKDDVFENHSTLVIGDMTTGEYYYYFNKENSNLITVMDYRYKLSLSIYISIFTTIAGSIIVGKTTENKKNRDGR